MSSREQIKVKRLSPSPKELRKAMRKASAAVDMWFFELEWIESTAANARHCWTAEYDEVFDIIVSSYDNGYKMITIQKKNYKSVSQKKFRKYMSISIDFSLFKRCTIDTAKNIGENIMMGVIAGTKGVVLSRPVNPSTARKRKEMIERKKEN